MAEESNSSEESELQLPATTEDISTCIASENPIVQLLAVRAARLLLSHQLNPPIEDFVNIGIIPKCVQFLKSNNFSLQYEAAWVLTNIASGTSEQTMKVINAGAVPLLVELLSSSNHHVADQAVWALGNIAGDSGATRDLVLRHNALPALLKLFKPNADINYLKNLAWIMSNLCRNRTSSPLYNTVSQCMIYLCKMLYFTDTDLLVNTCWAILYLTDGIPDQIQVLVDSGVLIRLVELLGTEEYTVLNPTLKIVGNISAGNCAQIDSIVNAGVLRHLAALLMHSDEHIVKNATLTISNIIHGNIDQIDKVIQTGIIIPLLHVLKNGDSVARKDAAGAIRQLTSASCDEQLTIFVRSGAVQLMCDLIDSKDERTVVVVLCAIQNILSAATRSGALQTVCNLIKDCKGLEKIGNLQLHSSQQLNRISYHIIEYFFTNDNAEVPDSTNQGSEE